MKKPIIAALLVAGLSAPVMAQDWYGRNNYDQGYYGQGNYGHNWNHDERYRSAAYGSQCNGNRAQRMYFRIRRGVQTQNIDWRRAQELRAMVDRTAQMQNNFCARGLNDYQASRLDHQWDRVEAVVNREMGG